MDDLTHPLLKSSGIPSSLLFTWRAEIQPTSNALLLHVSIHFSGPTCNEEQWDDTQEEEQGVRPG
eukprot:6015905-Pyramimonas_sp.AAC.1